MLTRHLSTIDADVEKTPFNRRAFKVFDADGSGQLVSSSSALFDELYLWHVRNAGFSGDGLLHIQYMHFRRKWSAHVNL